MFSNILKTLDDIRFGKTDYQMHMKARAFNKRVGPASPSDDPLVIFAMPLVSRRRSEDWARVQANLATTLKSFFAQSNPNWVVYICGQDRPSLPDDPRIHFIETNISDKFYDKGDKRRALISHIARDLKRDGYYMQFDADDILHADFVEHVLSDNNGHGYLVDKGYFVALASNQVVELEHFDYYCGSCAAVYVDFRKHRHFTTLLKQHRSHNAIADICALFDRPIAAVPFPAVLYITGHGENMFGREGYLEDRTRKLIQTAVTEDQARDIFNDFAISWATLNKHENTPG